ncbi:hypothetical protein N866_16225, partial [Actinotalea ferrariae CF5-4]
MSAAGALVAADRDQKRRRAPAQRLVRQAPGHGVPRAAFAAATPAPARRIVLLDTAGKHRPVRLQFLPHDDETELVEAAERRHIRGREGSVKHV